MSETDSQSATNSQSATDCESETDESETEKSQIDEQTTPSRTSPLARFESLLLIAVGGFTGAVLRYAVAVALPGGFPWATLAVNVAGSFALGFLLHEATVAGQFSPRTRLVFGTGFLSSFTTYSTFAVQTAALSPMLAVANVGANYALGFVAVLGGRFAVRWLPTSEVTQ